MTIIHYTLGPEPQRSGGLTRYTADLVCEQSKSATVVMLYAQGWSCFNKNIGWRREGLRGGVECYTLTNSFPFPIPLSAGVRTPSDFVLGRTMSQAQMEGLYNQIKPDLLHVHTLMGLPKELLVFFKSKGVKLIFTAHDYFGICPKVNMINSRGEVCRGANEQRCRECNKASMPTLFLRLCNSKMVLKIKQYVKDRI